jgi:hypothetical protein
MNAVLVALTYVVQTLGVLALVGVPVWFLLSPANPRAYDDATYWLGDQQITRHDFDALRAQGHPVYVADPR